MYRVILIYHEGRDRAPAVFTGASWYDSLTREKAQARLDQVLVKRIEQGFRYFTSDMLSMGMGADFRAIEFSIEEIP